MRRGTSAEPGSSRAEAGSPVPGCVQGARNAEHKTNHPKLCSNSLLHHSPFIETCSCILVHFALLQENQDVTMKDFGFSFISDSNLNRTQR